MQVALATSIPEAKCRAINLGYRDINSIAPGQWRNREDKEFLLVKNAGEILYHFRERQPAIQS